LAGLLRFELRFPGASKLLQVNSRLDAYISPGQVATRPQPGFTDLGTPIGPSRLPSFALYAKGTEIVTVVAVVQQVPRIPLSTVGVKITGLVVPEPTFVQYIGR